MLRKLDMLLITVSIQHSVSFASIEHHLHARQTRQSREKNDKNRGENGTLGIEAALEALSDRHFSGALSGPGTRGPTLLGAARGGWRARDGE